MSFTLCFVESCSTEEVTSNVEIETISIYKDEIERYLNHLESNSNQADVVGTQNLKVNINMMTLKTFDLYANQKILVADVAPQNNFGSSSKTKIVFYLFGDKIFRGLIFVFEDNFGSYDYSKAIHIMLNEGDKKQLKYTGQVEIFSIKKKLELRGTLKDGKLVKSSAARILKKKLKNNARSTGCTNYYLVTSVGNTVVSMEFLYTSCDVNSGDITGGGGGYSEGGGSYNLGSLLILPVSPQENDIHTHKDSDNIITTYKFTDNVWKIVKVVLPDLVLKSGRESNYDFLNFEFPEHDQLVLGDDGLSYRYNSFSGNWTGNEVVLVTDAIIAQTIEDNIDDSKLDPCPKGIMDTLKNTTNNDIKSVINKLEANSIYTVDMKMGSRAQGYAQTQKVSTNNYFITVANDSYASSTQLFRAASLIHEIIHAYYHSVVDDNKNPTTTPLNNFPDLYQAYELKKYSGGTTVAQHDQMAKDYVDAMALALQEYYINNQPLLFPLASYEVFTDLAWGTLQEASIFNEKYKDGDPAKERILNRYRTESTGQSVETGTTKQQNPVGEPCN